VVIRGRRDRYRTTEPRNVYQSLKETHQLDQRSTHQACISRFDSGAYTRVQFLRAVSHSVGAYALPKDSTPDSDAEDDDDVRNGSDSDQPQSAVSEPQCRIFPSCIFHPAFLTVPHFPVSHFQSSR